MRRTLVVVLASIVPGLLFPAPAGAQQRVITAFLFRYNPSPVEVAPGETLVFVNADPLSGEGHSVTHAVPSGEQLFGSSVLTPGDSGDVIGVAELQPGSYPITCLIHAFMTGMLEVGRPS